MPFKVATSRIFFLLILVNSIICDTSLTVDRHDLEIKLDESEIIYILANKNFTPVEETLNIIVQHSDIASVNLKNINLTNLEPNENISIEVKALGAGKTDIYSNTTRNLTDVKNVYLRVTIFKNAILGTVSSIIGWIYFAAWSISFYPQAYINWKRRSVVGLNFDFLALNILGFILYAIFNLGLYYIPELKEEYSMRYPRGLNPVQANDIFFSVHAVIFTGITIIQCYMYERNDQRVSTTARIILAFFGVFLLVSVLIAVFNVIHWLDFLYYCSYVKLTITLIKYIPQAFMNYRRKSTAGWSIGNILLDFTGGMLSMLQMILNAYNYDDWASIFGDPTKFGLGLFSVIFDIFFMLQHYVFYRTTTYTENY